MWFVQHAATDGKLRIVWDGWTSKKDTKEDSTTLLRTISIDLLQESSAAKALTSYVASEVRQTFKFDIWKKKLKCKTLKTRGGKLNNSREKIRQNRKHKRQGKKGYFLWHKMFGTIFFLKVHGSKRIDILFPSEFSFQ